MKRAVIVGGAPIGRIESIRAYLRADDTMIYCDGGLRHMAALGRGADLIVGDFDSHENPHAAVETIVLPHEKDDTDTYFAAKEALRRGFRDFLLLGAAGARLDHTLGNLGLLMMLDEAGAKALLVDDYSEMEIVSRSPARVRGAKYPLENVELPCDTSLGVSNEPLPGQTASVRVDEGRLLLIRIREE